MVKISLSSAIRDELAARKQTLTDLWDGKPLSKIPLDIRVAATSEHSMRAQMTSLDKQLAAASDSVNMTLRYLKYTDAIPSMRPDVGCSCLATAFGCDYFWGDSEDQTPGIRQPLITDIETQLERLPAPQVTDGWLGEGLRRIAAFAEAGDGAIPVSLLDAAGGVNVAADLMGIDSLLESMYTTPERVHALLEKIQRFYLEVLAASVDAACGEANITTTDFLDFWAPAGRKGHVSDDISAMYSPAFYEEFSAPYHSMIYEKYGCGGLHNCGPNPCAAGYVGQALSPRCIDLSYTYSRDDLPALRDIFHKKAFIYLSWDRSAPPEQWYRSVIDAVGGDVIVVPQFSLSESDDIPHLYATLGALAREHAEMIEWGFDQ